MKNQKSKPLLALTSAALALPGMTPTNSQAQDGITTDPVFSYRYTAYSEEAIPGDVNNVGEDVDRYSIDVHQVRFLSAITKNTEISIDLQSESMTGASPIYVLPGSDGPIQVMSSATITEERNDLDVAFTTYNNRTISTTGISYSGENDYSSFGLRTNYTWLFNEKNTTVEAGMSVSQDFIDATQDQNPDAELRVTDAERRSASFTLGFSQVLGKSTLMSSSVNIANFTGYMSDPYKEIWISDIGETVPDSRPHRRSQWAWSNRFRQNFNSVKGALHFDYRYFGSNWEMDSHTVDVRWVQDFGGGWQVTPSVRYYSQGAAIFFSNWYDFERADGFHSSDYRLSEYSAISARFKVSKQFKRGAVHLLYENYTSDATSDDPQLASPSLVDFSYITVGFDWQF